MSLVFGIRKKPIPHPVFKKAPDPGSGSATLVLDLINILNKKKRSKKKAIWIQ
jgi:hypothetical protein